MHGNDGVGTFHLGKYQSHAYPTQQAAEAQVRAE